jgi:hypothetical protein
MKTVLGVVLVALAAGACGGLGPYPSAQVTTMAPAWVTRFTLDWAMESETSGTQRLRGYVHNTYGEEAAEVQLLTQSLDASGAIIDQRINWAGSVPAFSRTSFEVRTLPAAHEYRVTVWWFSFHQREGWF